jgi:hypothetical protein
VEVRLNLNVAQFPNGIESNIQMRNICPSEARSMITNFQNNIKKKNPKIMKCSKTVPKQCKFTKTNKNFLSFVLDSQLKSFKASFMLLKKN